MLQNNSTASGINIIYYIHFNNEIAKWKLNTVLVETNFLLFRLNLVHLPNIHKYYACILWRVEMGHSSKGRVSCVVFLCKRLNTWRKLRRLNIIRDSSKAFSLFCSSNEDVCLSFILTLQV
jgi:hypothetical protein